MLNLGLTLHMCAWREAGDLGLVGQMLQLTQRGFQCQIPAIGRIISSCSFADTFCFAVLVGGVTASTCGSHCPTGTKPI